MPNATTTANVYLVHPDGRERERLHALIAQGGFAVREFASTESFLGTRDDRGAGCLVVDSAGRSAADLLDSVRAKHPGLPAILIANPGGVPAAVHAMRAGASAYLEQPVSVGALIQEIRRALEHDPRSVQKGDRFILSRK